MVPGGQGQGVRPARPRGQALRRRPAAAAGGDGGGVACGRLLAPLAGRVCRWDSWYVGTCTCLSTALLYSTYYLSTTTVHLVANYEVRFSSEYIDLS